ncbi:VOC family protein [Paenibacillus sp. GCM10027627]|uniref:VOC family protein n=1 Tax=unclassified Paenibacillus TaxID=185978 RepID=UPI003625F367
MYKPGFTIWYDVADLDRSIAFFTEKLQFELVFHDVEGGMVIVGTNTKDCTIGFSQSERVIPSTSSSVFEVANIEKAVQDLSAKGVSFVGEIEEVPGMVKLATFVDPDGHNYMLSESLIPL